MNKLHAQTTPWYKQRWPWIIMAGPAIVVVAALYTGYVAFVNNEGLVDDNYYKDGLTVSKDMRLQKRQENLALTLGLKATASIIDTRVDLSLQGLHHDAVPQSLQLRLVHPTRNADQTVILERDANASGDAVHFVGTLTEKPGDGHWKALLTNYLPVPANGSKPGAANWKATLLDPVAGWRMDAVWPVTADAPKVLQLVFSAQDDQVKRQPVDLTPAEQEHLQQVLQQKQLSSR